MDNKEIVEKALKGEDYSELVKEFTPEQTITLNQEIVAASNEKVQEKKRELAGITAEKERREKNLPQDNLDVQKQFRTEQFEKAKSNFYKEFTLTDEEKSALDVTFSKIDSGKVDPDNILTDLKRAYISLNPDKFLEATKKVREFEKNAADFNSMNAGGAGGGNGGEDDKHSEAAKTLFKAWTKQGLKGVTIDDAQKQIDKGANWNKSDLSK